MKTTRSLLVILTMIGMARVAQAGTFTWDPDTIHVGDHFTLGSGGTGTRSNNDLLVGTLPEISQQYLTTGVRPTGFDWEGSSSLKLQERSSGSSDGQIVDGTGTSTPKLAYVDAAALPPNALSNCLWWVQADVKPTASDHVALGYVYDYDTPSVTNKTFEGGLGMLWAELEYKNNAWFANLCANTINVNDMMLIPAVELPGYTATESHTLAVDWALDTNTAGLWLDGTLLGSRDMSGLINWDYWDTYGFGFELSGGASLDNFAATPEPGTIVMMGFGLVGLGLVVYRKKQQSRNSQAA